MGIDWRAAADPGMIATDLTDTELATRGLSYGNDTNIFTESDVDIVICYKDAFFYDLDEPHTGLAKACSRRISQAQLIPTVPLRLTCKPLLSRRLAVQFSPQGKPSRLRPAGRVDPLTLFVHFGIAGIPTSMVVGMGRITRA